MKKYIEDRAVEIANYIIENNATVRQAAKQFGISKSTVHTAIFEREAGMETSKVNLAKLKKAAKTLENSIDWWDKKLLQLEATTPLKNLMERQKKSCQKNICHRQRHVLMNPGQDFMQATDVSRLRKMQTP